MNTAIEYAKSDELEAQIDALWLVLEEKFTTIPTDDRWNIFSPKFFYGLEDNVVRADCKNYEELCEVDGMFLLFVIEVLEDELGKALQEDAQENADYLV